MRSRAPLSVAALIPERVWKSVYHFCCSEAHHLTVFLDAILSHSRVSEFSVVWAASSSLVFRHRHHIRKRRNFFR